MKPEVSERSQIEEELQVIDLEVIGEEDVVEMTPGRVYTFDDKTFEKSQSVDDGVDEAHVPRRIKRSVGFGGFVPPRHG